MKEQLNIERNDIFAIASHHQFFQWMEARKKEIKNAEKLCVVCFRFYSIAVGLYKIIDNGAFSSLQSFLCLFAQADLNSIDSRKTPLHRFEMNLFDIVIQRSFVTFVNYLNMENDWNLLNQIEDGTNMIELRFFFSFDVKNANRLSS